MSQTPQSPQSPAFKVEAKIGEVIATLGYVPAIMPIALAERAYDAVSHHRLGVLSDARTKFPGKRKAQKFLAAKLRRYGPKDPVTVTDARVKSIAIEDDTERMGEDALLLLEQGGDVSAREPMIIGLNRLDEEERKNLKYIPTARVYILFKQGRKYLDKEQKDLGRIGDRTMIFPVTRVRKARKLLGYFARWDANLPRVLDKYGRDLEMMLRVAGQATLARRIELNSRARSAGRLAYATVLAGSPEAHAQARQAAKLAAQRVRADKVGGGN